MDDTGTNQTDWQETLLAHARRQTEALESIRGILLFFVAVTIVGVLIAAAMATSG